jgi:hypothetical protein
VAILIYGFGEGAVFLLALDLAFMHRAEFADIVLIRDSPYCSLRCLRNREDDAFERAVANGPRGVRVLIDVEGLVQGGGRGTGCKEDGKRENRASLHLPIIHQKVWCARTDSNGRPSGSKPDALSS